ncbi:fatty-acyl-CoA synthase [Parafrankia irregularis]|uniref:Fatty-acyl-CoA synthase n=1 Tax=Parafrankia irregularis TaxID=795642 RepID=A0A0S4QRN8_9ACTN|nr:MULTISPECIES: AMP-binding protein [Parafrankia]MBE3201749.1 AMP-binding protein [Parafrankia sp. CH37]CUU57500.1 fatty-acyl-CoA synthase [Parafrankia irregularis]
MTANEWSLPAVLDVVTDVAPEREMLVWTTVRRSYAQVQDRTRRLAAFLVSRGLGVRHERAELERWECGQSPVAILLSNCPEYIEAMIGAFRARAVPFNVNHHYAPREIGALLDQVGAEAIVYHRRLGPAIAAAGAAGCLLLEVDDGSGVEPLPGSIAFEEAIATAGDVENLPEPSPDDLYLVCTGGTTGTPKGVLWRQADVYVSAAGGVDGATRELIASIAGNGAGAWFAAPPLMHGAAQWTAFAGLDNGATVILHDDAKPFDAPGILETIERERVTLMSIVGDAYARPLLEQLQARPYDLSSLVRLGTGGAVTSASVKHGLLELLPGLTVVDGYGASETGGMAFGASRKGAETREFEPSPGAAVLSADRSRFLAPGEDEIGWVARVGRTPLGYLNDRAKTEETFPIIDGQRAAVPGDRARLTTEGRIELFGRDAMVVNTGGEKVFVEEVEEVLRQHPDVLDALVVGRPSERFGQEVVALVQARPGTSPAPGELREFVALSLARFKAPRAVLICDRLGRHPTGKADYTWARKAAVDAVPATTVRT